MTEFESGTPAAGGDNGAGGGGDGTATLDNNTSNNQPTLQEWDNLPKSWTRDLEPEWKMAPEKVRQFVHRREADVDRGIRSYADGHGRWNKLQGVFADVIRENPELDVAGVYETLAQNHLALARTTDPAQRREMLMRMAQHYGVDFAQAAAGPQGAQATEGLTAAQKAELERILNPVLQKVETVHKHLTTEQSKALEKSIDGFFSDPKNEFVNEPEVGNVMAEIVKSGATRDLGEAYQLAVLRIPAVRAKYLASLTKAAGDGKGGTGGLNIKSTAAPASSGQPKTIDETMQEVVDKHYPKR